MFHPETMVRHLLHLEENAKFEGHVWHMLVDGVTVTSHLDGARFFEICIIFLKQWNVAPTLVVLRKLSAELCLNILVDQRLDLVI